MDKLKFILSTIVLVTLISLTFEKSYSDIDSVALETPNMNNDDENMKNMTVPAYSLEKTPAILTPLAITNNSGHLKANDSLVSNQGNSTTSSTKICRNIDVRNKVGCFIILITKRTKTPLLLHKHVTA